MNTDIRTLRLAKGIRQGDLADYLGISVSSLSKIERHLLMPEVELIEKLARRFEIPFEELMIAHSEDEASKTIGEGYTTAIPGGNFKFEPQQTPDTARLPLIDLFCGTGGFSHGFERTGKFEVRAGIDLLSDRINTFSQNHPTAHAFCTDIAKINLHDLATAVPNPFVIIGGPPCQGFSSIRPFRTLTERDSRNNLFEHFAIVVSQFRPKWFVLENVVGLLTHKHGETLSAMLKLFSQIGYSVSWRILNAALFGLPQRRERFILVGNRDGYTFQWPNTTHYLNGSFRSMAGKKHAPVSTLPMFDTELHPAIAVMEAIHDLPEIQSGEIATQYRDDIVPTSYEREMRGNQQILTLHESTKHSAHMMEIIRHSGFSRADLPEGLTTSGFSTAYSRLEPDLPSVTLTVNFVHPASNKCIHPYQDRALTPREGARLQGFEDSYIFSGTRSQIVKQIGNAVPPILGKVIAEAILQQEQLE